MEGFYIEHWLTTFCIFCMIGWLQESTIESLYRKKLTNRGFLKGPYIPIYGFGGLLLLLITVPFKENPFFVYFIAMLACTILEYFTGYIMEKVFNKQFWDYSMLKLVYKNRISLLSSLFWGLLGLFMAYILSGIIQFVVIRIPYPLIVIFPCAFIAIMAIDFFKTTRRELSSRGQEDENRYAFSISSKLNFISKYRSRINNNNNEEDDESDE